MDRSPYILISILLLAVALLGFSQLRLWRRLERVEKSLRLQTLRSLIEVSIGDEPRDG